MNGKGVRSIRGGAVVKYEYKKTEGRWLNIQWIAYYIYNGQRIKYTMDIVFFHYISLEACGLMHTYKKE